MKDSVSFRLRIVDEGTVLDMFLARNIVVGVEMPPEHPWSSAQVQEPSRRAVRQALQLSRAAGLPVTLVTVLPPVSAGWFESAEKAQREQTLWTREAELVLQALASELGGASGQQATVDCVVSTGTPWVELLRVTKNSPHTLLVCGTRDAGRLTRALFGSTGNKLLRHACGPVWLVKPQADEQQPLEILAATDLTEVGQDVLQTAVSLARSIPSKLHVLHVVEDILDRHIRRTGVSAERLEELKKKSHDQAEHAVHDQLAATDFRTLPFGAQVHITTGSPDLEIPETIERLGINLLVLAARGRGGLSGILVGNTAEQLLPELTCSIIVIKPEGFVSPCAF